jgi:hypothetical protein
MRQGLSSPSENIVRGAPCHPILHLWLITLIPKSTSTQWNSHIVLLWPIHFCSRGTIWSLQLEKIFTMSFIWALSEWSWGPLLRSVLCSCVTYNNTHILPFTVSISSERVVITFKHFLHSNRASYMANVPVKGMYIIFKLIFYKIYNKPMSLDLFLPRVVFNYENFSILYYS